MTIETLVDGSPDATHTYLFAHGAGGAMDTPFMNDVAAALGERGIRVVRFEFPYMAARRTTGKRGAPDRQPLLLETWRQVIAEHGGGPNVVIGGKSMGGRMASMVADEVHARGLLCFGYPFHPPGKPQQLRTAHLLELRTPALVIQGTRDIFGNPDEVATYELSPNLRIEWIENGDHSLFKSRHKDAAKFTRTIELAATFITSL
ncbi:MAG TPA: alpha/beta family hydrolase [Thermoanaerobaculia bacterium]|nr:alpha/beta family hydrolase [Thermoanaerobaculia bacterium]